MNLRAIALAVTSFGFGVLALFVAETNTGLMSHLQRHTDYRVLDTPKMPWVHGHDDGVDYDMKFLYRDPVARESAMLLRYAAGQVNGDHIHSHGHAMYVLQGRLATHRGVYGPGSFVWFPPGEVVSHGATPDEDVVVIFLRHEDMTTEHLHGGAVH